MDPLTCAPSPTVWASRVTTTSCETPLIVSVPVAWTVAVPLDRPDRSTGEVRTNVAVGCSEVSRIPRNCRSRPESSVSMVVMSTSMLAAVSVPPSIVTPPRTSLVRPTTVTSCPERTSSTR
ncbi:hypothetical protein D3C74_404340 [compost metagenome]